jgi:hypothetical protein
VSFEAVDVAGAALAVVAVVVVVAGVAEVVAAEAGVPFVAQSSSLSETVESGSILYVDTNVRTKGYCAQRDVLGGFTAAWIVYLQKESCVLLENLIQKM